MNRWRKWLDVFGATLLLGGGAVTCAQTAQITALTGEEKNTTTASQCVQPPVSLFVAGFNAGLDHASNNDPTFGQGGSGYARRFGATFASQTTSRFFGDFLYPTVFFEDPRYYRMAYGSKKARLVHAMSHVVVARRDNGNSMFNFTEWLATSSSLALNNPYHPGNQPGLAAAARNGAFSVLQDMGFDVLREFWPEVARKFSSPFRGVPGEDLREE